MKCEHGLTTKECYVCMSPKYGKHDTKQERVAKPQQEEHMTLQEELEQGIYPTDPFTRLTDEQWKLLLRNMKKQEVEQYEEALL